jgi:hypothetical protein
MTIDRAMARGRKTGPPVRSEIERAVMTLWSLPVKLTSEVPEQNGLTLPVGRAESCQELSTIGPVIRLGPDSSRSAPFHATWPRRHTGAFFFRDFATINAVNTLTMSHRSTHHAAIAAQK